MSQKHRGNGIRGRTLSRVAAVQALFQWEQGNEKSAKNLIEQFLFHRNASDSVKIDYEEGKTYITSESLFSNIVDAAVKQHEHIDQLLCNNLPKDWTYDRLDPVIRALLRAAMAELLDEKGPPTRVVINEYIDVAHGFFIGEEFRMINGILNTMCRLVRPEEVEISEK